MGELLGKAIEIVASACIAMHEEHGVRREGIAKAAFRGAENHPVMVARDSLINAIDEGCGKGVAAEHGDNNNATYCKSDASPKTLARRAGDGTDWAFDG